MRELKFRDWDGTVMGYGNWDFSSGCPTLLQYTGLTDKHGKELYCGDVLSPPTGLAVPWKLGEVRFSRGSFRVHGFLLSEICDSTEVLGNIYENKELNYDPLSDR
jgi:hypothetical protein